MYVHVVCLHVHVCTCMYVYIHVSHFFLPSFYLVSSSFLSSSPPLLLSSSPPLLPPSSSASFILYSNTVTNNGKTTTLPLTHWSETYQHPGLICALTTGTNNPVVLTIKPESIQVYNDRIKTRYMEKILSL